MNYSVFKLQNQAGRPAIFWEKETVPKNDRKFGYKNNTQRFPIRQFAGDRHHVETDLVSLTPDEPPPPPKPAKNFIKRNRQKIAAKKPEPPSTVTLTQDQLNAILRSVGKVAGGSENAVKITVDKHNDTKQILVESPRRHDHDDEDYDDDYNDRRERRRKKKSDRKQEDQGEGIYAFLDDKSKLKATSDNESVDSTGSLELRRLTKQYKRRKDRKSRRQEEEDDDDDHYVRDKNRRNKNIDLDDDDNSREKRNRRNRSNNLQDEIDREIQELKRRNRSKQRDEEEDSDYEKENRRRPARSKRHDSGDDNYDRDFDRRDRNRKSDRTKKDDSRDRKGKKSRNKSEERDLDVQNTSVNKEDEELIPSPRDKIGLPIDLSWRHMTKAERRRLEAARQKVVEEDERKEEVRIKQLNAQYDPDESFKKAPTRHQPTRSDPPATRQTRYDRGRETENTNYTDGNRHGRRSRSPSDQRTPERSPDLPSYTTPDASPKAPIGVPRRHMTLAEKKRQEWERERVESVQIQRTGQFDPWGKPGAGAPLRSRSGHVVADYKGRQDQMHNETIQEEEPSSETAEKSKPAEQGTRHSERWKPARGKSPPPVAAKNAQGLDMNVPVTMRSSFVLGQAAPDFDRLTSAKERERKLWLAELEKQIEEKRQKETKHNEIKEDNYWADKFGQSHRPAQFPEQPQEIATGDKLNTSRDYAAESSRVQSAPDAQDLGSHIRGQNAPIDPVTKQELEDKRKRYLEHQAAVKAQVEEKERQKRTERERKMKEDMEEDRKLQDERQMLQKQFDMEQQKIKQKEQQRQAQVNQLKAAMDEAQAKALQEKYQRKMQHLEAGGHDTTKLREHLEGEITSRIEQLHTRRERDIQRARQLLELQYWGVSKIAEEEEPNESQVKEEKPSSAKVTPRDDSVTLIEPSHIPGLDLSTARTQLPQQMPTTRRDQPHGQFSQAQSQGHYNQAHTHTNEPYTENRILTPSRYRHPSKPWSEPGSPQREFGTQTGKLNDSASELDGDDLSRLLNPRFQRDDSDVNIEYKYERGKKVRVISAPKAVIEKRSRKPKHPQPPPSHRESSRSPHEHHHEVRDKMDKEEVRRKKRLELQRRKGPVKPGSRPMWGYKNAESRKAKKQSERDPFYEQKKHESEMRRLKREQKLLAMVEANKPVIPDYYVPPPKSSRSRSRDQSPFSDVEMASPREVRPNRRSKSHSPNRQVLHVDSEHFYSHGYHNEGKSGDRGRHWSKSPPRGRSESRSVDRSVEDQHVRSRHMSPPVPALRHRNDANQNMDDEKFRKGGKYRDADPLDKPVANGDFVPFTRTIDVLDPTKAEEPLPLSREATRVANARRAYFEGLHPEKFGNRQYAIQDKHRILPGHNEEGKNPLINPSLVLDHPTTRQDQILLQLSTLKQSLMQRQRELETFSPTDLVRMDTDIRA